MSIKFNATMTIMTACFEIFDGYISAILHINRIGIIVNANVSHPAMCHPTKIDGIPTIIHNH